MRKPLFIIHSRGFEKRGLKAFNNLETEDPTCKKKDDNRNSYQHEKTPVNTVYISLSISSHKDVKFRQGLQKNYIYTYFSEYGIKI